MALNKRTGTDIPMRLTSTVESLATPVTFRLEAGEYVLADPSFVLSGRMFSRLAELTSDKLCGGTVELTMPEGEEEEDASKHYSFWFHDTRYGDGFFSDARAPDSRYGVDVNMLALFPYATAVACFGARPYQHTPDDIVLADFDNYAHDWVGRHFSLPRAGHISYDDGVFVVRMEDGDDDAPFISIDTKDYGSAMRNREIAQQWEEARRKNPHEKGCICMVLGARVQRAMERVSPKGGDASPKPKKKEAPPKKRGTSK